MFFVSAPSLIIYAVVAIFYLANITFFAVNRYQEESGKATAATVHPPAEAPMPQHAVFACFDDAIVKKHTIRDRHDQKICRQWFYEYMAVVRNGFQFIYCASPFIGTEQGIMHQLFFRPPPVIG